MREDELNPRRVVACVLFVVVAVFSLACQRSGKSMVLSREYFVSAEDIRRTGRAGEIEQESRMVEGGRSFYGMDLYFARRDAQFIEVLLQKFVCAKNRLPIGSGHFFTAELVKFASENKISSDSVFTLAHIVRSDYIDAVDTLQLFSSSYPVVLLCVRFPNARGERIVLYNPGPDLADNYSENDDVVIASYLAYSVELY